MVKTAKPNGRSTFLPIFQWRSLLRSTAFIAVLLLAPFAWGQTLTTEGLAAYDGGNGLGSNPGVTFVVENTSAGGIVITDLSSFWQTGNNGAIPTLWASASNLSGPFTPFDANQWTMVATGSALSIPSNGYYPTLSGLSYFIPAGETRRFLLESTNGVRYSGTGVITPNTVSGAGVNMRMGDYQIAGVNVGYANSMTATTAGNTPRYFTGSITFMPAAACVGTPTAGTISGPSMVCAGSTAALSLNGSTLATGITRTWFSSTTQGGPYTTPAGTGTSITTGPINTTTYFVVEVACSEPGGGTATTAEFMVEANTGSSGTFTINNGSATGGTNFANFTDAINYLNSVGNCISGPMLFNVAAGQTFTEDPPAVTAIGGASSPITFIKDGAGANPVITPAGGVGSNDFGFGIIGGDYITVDGIDIHVGTSTAVEYGFLIRNSSAENGAHHNTIRNSSITLNRTNTASLGLVISSSTLAAAGGGFTPTSAAGASSNNLVENVTISNASRGLYIISGAPNFPGLNNQVLNSTIGADYTGIPDGDIGTGTTAAYGMLLTAQSGATVRGNIVRNIAATATNRGIYFLTGQGTIEISNNRVYGVRNTGPTSTLTQTGIDLQGHTNGAQIRVFNNYVSDITSARATGTDVATRALVGISTGTGGATTTYYIDHNNVSIDGSTSPGLSNMALEFGNVLTVNIARNNILANHTGAQTGAAGHMAVRIVNASSLGATGSFMDHNVLFIANATNGHIGMTNTTPQTTLANWTAAVTESPDVNSLTVNPALVDPVMNPRATNIDLAGEGLPAGIAWITEDIEGESRPTPATIGANEIDPSATCSGTPTPGEISGETEVCVGSEVTLNLTDSSLEPNITRNWFSSTTSGGPYTTFVGEGFSITPTITENTYFIVEVTCTEPGGGTATTAEFLVQGNPASPGGTFTINNTLPTGGTNFANFTEAINHLNGLDECGDFSGAWVFNVAAGQTFPENPPAVTASGTATFTITFQKDGGGANPVIAPTGTAASNDFGFGINGGNYIIVDGIDIHVGTSTAVEYGFFIRNATSINGSSNNTIRNSKVTLNRTNTSSIGILISTSTLAAAGNALTPTSLEGGNHNNTIDNMTVENASRGIYIISGSTAWPSMGNQVLNSTIGAPYAGIPTGDIGTGTTPSYGMLLTSQSGATVRGNIVQNIAATALNRGIYFLTAQGITEVSNNRVRGIRNTGTASTSVQTGIDLQGQTAGTEFRVFNNFVSDITAARTGTDVTTRVLVGISTGTGGASTTYQIDHNNVSIDGSGSLSVSSVALEFGNVLTVNIARNNNLANFTAAQPGTAKHYAIRSANLSSIGAEGSYSDYNNFYIANTTGGFVAQSATTDHATIAVWDNFMTQDVDQNSITVDPGYVNNQFDLHVTNMALSGAGTPVAVQWATLDIDGEFRPTPPTIGAHELAPVSECEGIPTAGSITDSSFVCAGGAGTTLTFSGQSGPGITYQWASSTTSGGPYTDLADQDQQHATGTLTQDTYYVMTTTCTLSGQSNTSPEYMVEARPVPSATASNDSPVCVGDVVQLTGTTDIGTSFAWTGPSGFTSAAQNPTVTINGLVNGGNYSFTATFNGCTSSPATTNVAVNEPIVISAVTATPDPICSGGTTQLEVLAATTQDYCLPTENLNCASDYISNVQFAGIVRSSTCDGNLAPGKSLFTTPQATVVAGNSYSISMTNPPSWSMGFKVWIDLDQNGVFSDVNELVFSSASLPAGSTHTGTVFIPANAKNGQTRIRFMGRFAGEPVNACQMGTTLGEMEDYFVNISGGVANELTYSWTPASFLDDATSATPIASGLTQGQEFTVEVSDGLCSESASVFVEMGADVSATLVDDCIGQQFSVAIDVASLGSATAVEISYTVNGVPTTVTTSTSTVLGPFAITDLVEVTSNNGYPSCAEYLGYFFTACPIVVDCNASQALQINHCYRNNDPRTFTFVASDPSITLDLKFLQPSPIGASDGISLFAGTAGNNQLPVTYFNNELSTMGTVTSLNDTITLTIQTDGIGSCFDGTITDDWNFQVRCTGCGEPEADLVLVENCATQSFQASLDLYYLGFSEITGNDATSATISYTINGGPAIVISNAVEDVYDLGTHPLGTIIDVSIFHQDDGTCNNLLGELTVPWSACANDEPCDARPLTMNLNYTCGSTTEGSLADMTPSAVANPCTGTADDDIWYSFVATSTTHRVQILNVAPLTALIHSLYVGTCDGTLSPVANTCSTANTSNPAGLTPGQTYFVRVFSAGSVPVNTTFDVCVSAPPVIDMQATALVSPPGTGCYGPSMPVTVTIRNNALVPIDFSQNPTTVNATATGGYSSSQLVNSGTLAPGATMNVTMAANINMSAYGTYTFNASTSALGEGNPSNDAMAPVTRTNATPAPLPLTNNFNDFTGANLPTAYPGWFEGQGVLTPTIVNGLWLNSAAAQTTLFGSTTARVVMSTTGLRNEWIITPKIVPVQGAVLTYTIAVTQASGSANAPPVTANGTQGMQGTDDAVIVRGSLDCGLTWFDIYTMNASNTIGLTNVMQPRSVDLTAWAGQELVLAFYARRTTVAASGGGAYDFHLDDIVVQVGDVCTGAPVAGTAASSVAGPICAPGSTSLSVTGQTTTGGIVISWYSSTDPLGPFTAIPGAVTNPYPAQGLTETTYFQAWVKCALSGDSTATNVVSTAITPTPTVTATNDGPVCAGQDIQLTATTNFGATFQWSGPQGFSSTQQNPFIGGITTAQGGNYTVITTGNGCPSQPSTTFVEVQGTPNITDVSADPATICSGGSTQLNVTVDPEPVVLISEITLFRTGTGATSPYPAHITGADLVELNNISNIPADVSGWTLSAYNSATATPSHSITFPMGTVIPVQGALVVHIGPGTDQPSLLYFNTGGANDSYFSSSNIGVVLFDGSGIHDVVAAGTSYTFDSSIGVTTADWSGLATRAGAGTTRFGASDTNTGADWAAPSVANPQTIGTYNPWYDQHVVGLPATYSWSPTTYLNDATIEDPTASNMMETTTYTVTVGTSAGCTSTGNVTVFVGEPLVAGISQTAETVCEGTAVTLTAVVDGGGQPYSYSWSPGGATTAEITVEPTETTEYMLTVTDDCGAVMIESATITITPVPNATASSTAPPVCTGSTLELTGSSDIGTSYLWTGPNNFSSTDLSPIIPDVTQAASGTYTLVASTGSCSSEPATTEVSVLTSPADVTAEASETAVCAGGTVDLTATGTTEGIALASDFNSATQGWTVVNNSTGGNNPELAQWTLRQSPYTVGFTTFSSPDASQFFHLNSDAQGSGGTTISTLTSPVFSLVGFTSATLSFEHFYQHWTSGYVLTAVQVSTNGTTWTNIQEYNSTVGSSQSFATANLNLDAYAGEASVQVRFSYHTSFGYHWAIDNVTVGGQQNAAFSWTSDPAGFSSTDQNPTGVIVSEATTYTVVVSTPTGCISEASVLVNITTTGEPCDAGTGPGTGVIDANCDCIPTGTPDCEGVIGGPAVPGTPCDPGPGMTTGTWNADCECIGTEIHVAVTSSAMLDGAFDATSGLMRDDLRSLGFIPNAHPYAGAPFNHTGTETIDAGVLDVTGADAIVDWVLLELRDEITPTTIVATRAALIQRDGDIVDTDGVSSVKFPGVAAGDYHLAVRHRNHLAVMTASSYALSMIPTDIDLTVATTATYGTDARRTVGLVMTMWAGNVNTDAVVNYSGSNNDRAALLNTLGASNYLSPMNGYYNADVNMSGVVTYSGTTSDRATILNTLGATNYLIPITEQLP